jgi:hypothetical protein
MSSSWVPKVGEMVYGVSRVESTRPPMYMIHHGVVRESDANARMVHLEDGLPGGKLIILLMNKTFRTRTAALADIVAMSEQALSRYCETSIEKPGSIPEHVIEAWRTQVEMAKDGAVPMIGGLIDPGTGKPVSFRQRKIRTRKMKRSNFLTVCN